MATTITAGNATNGLAFSADNTGILELKTGTGAGTTALTIDASQVVSFANAPTGAGMLTSGTSVTASGTSVDFTSIPSTAKRITVIFRGISTSGSSAYLIQIGSGSVTITGYISTGNSFSQANTTTGTTSTAGFVISGGGAAGVGSGQMVITAIGSNAWVASHCLKISTTNINLGGGDVALSGALDRIRITTVNGTDTFDAGTINILWE
jgi:hypothetical protein